jgi:hypothetical protein
MDTSPDDGLNKLLAEQVELAAKIAAIKTAQEEKKKKAAAEKQEAEAADRAAG